MIYLTGDTHMDFRRFTKKKRARLQFDLKEGDMVIVCGDFGLLWEKNSTFEYYSDWMRRLPFKLLWVAGNHENYDMLEEYNCESWHGGKVRHIIRDQVIYLERGQVFRIEGKKFFTFGGASSHDVQGGILDPDDPDYRKKYIAARRSGLPFRIKGKTWWEQELPSEEEMQEGLRNLKKVNYKVDYIITHCGSSRAQSELERIYGYDNGNHAKIYKEDILTEYFDQLEDKLEYRRWYCGHYHVNRDIDEKHMVLFERVIPLD